MTRKQFAEVLAVLSAAVEKPFAAETAEVYWAVLGDLPLDVFRAAAKVVVLTHAYKTIPLASELRKAASDVIQGQISDMTPANAWEACQRAAKRIDLDISGPYWARGKTYASQAASVMDELPPLVARAMSAFGLADLCNAAKGASALTTIRAQFLKVVEQQIEHRRKLALMPPALAKEIESHTLPASAARAIESIGAEKF